MRKVLSILAVIHKTLFFVPDLLFFSPAPLPRATRVCSGNLVSSAYWEDIVLTDCFEETGTNQVLVRNRKCKNYSLKQMSTPKETMDKVFTPKRCFSHTLLGPNTVKGSNKLQV